MIFEILICRFLINEKCEFKFNRFSWNKSAGRSNGKARKLNGHARIYWYLLEKQKGELAVTPASSTVFRRTADRERRDWNERIPGTIVSRSPIIMNEWQRTRWRAAANFPRVQWYRNVAEIARQSFLSLPPSEESDGPFPDTTHPLSLPVPFLP